MASSAVEFQREVWVSVIEIRRWAEYVVDIGYGTCRWRTVTSYPNDDARKLLVFGVDERIPLDC
jgi:hypothetical protein